MRFRIKQVLLYFCNRLIGRRAGCIVGQVARPAVWLAELQSGRQAGRLIGRQAYSLAVRLP